MADMHAFAVTAGSARLLGTLVALSMASATKRVKNRRWYMTQQQIEVQATIQSMAEEQVLFLKNRYKMNADEIISLYTGERKANATYSDAIHSISAFNAQNAKKHGFIAG